MVMPATCPVFTQRRVEPTQWRWRRSRSAHAVAANPNVGVALGAEPAEEGARFFDSGAVHGELIGDAA